MSKFANPSKAVTAALAEHSRARRCELKGAVALATVASSSRRNDLLAELVLEERSIASLKGANRKLRRAQAKHIAEVAQSMAMFGIVDPILIDRDGNVIDGFIRLEATKSLGLETITCLVADQPTPDELRLLRIALNRLGEKGEWDLGELKLEFEELLDLGAPLEVTGFVLPEIDQIMMLDEPLVDDAVNAVPEIKTDVPAVTQLGDSWKLGRHCVLCADAREFASYTRLFGDAPPARVVITDAPFGCKIEGLVSGNGTVKHKDFIDGSGGMDSKDLEELLAAAHANAARHLVDGGLIFSFMDYRELETLLRVGGKLGFALLNILVWDKGRGGMGGLYRNACEFISVFKSGKAPHLNMVALGKYGRDRTTVLAYAGATTKGSLAHEQLHAHPTPKSVELIADLMIDTTNRGEIVLDPFLGSGTAIIAAEKTGRTAYGLELDGHYCDVIVRRFEKFTGIDAIHAGTGMTFAQVAAERRAAQTESSVGSVAAKNVAATSNLVAPTCDGQAPDGQIAMPFMTDQAPAAVAEIHKPASVA